MAPGEAEAWRYGVWPVVIPGVAAAMTRYRRVTANQFSWIVNQ